MRKYKIGISCIGSGVGQSVINSCRLSELPITTVGFGTNPFAYGMYDCDDYDYTPSIYQDDYIDRLIEVCTKHEIDLLIPGLDDEALFISRQISKFDAAGIKVIVAGEELLNICRDKERMSNELNPITDIFVKSYSKSDFLIGLESGTIDLPVIAKPRDGFASRGIEIITKKEQAFKVTEAHIVQELAVPHQQDPEHDFYLKQLNRNINPQVAEISIQVVADQNGEIIGKMISYNKLNNGVPIEVIPYENEAIWTEVFKLYPTLKKLGIKGPFNLQGRVTDKGLKLFELQARFTGITGLRAYMGFNEVEACIRSWLGIQSDKIKLNLNYNRFGIRQTADKSLSIDLNKRVTDMSIKLNGKVLKPKKTILVTGVTGYLGRAIMKSLVDDTRFEVIAHARDKVNAATMFPITELFNDEDIVNGNLSFGNIDIILHCGFARPHNSNDKIAESLLFTAELFRRAIQNQVSSIINISSQSVYGQGSTPPWGEDSPIVPNTPYASAKYSSEVILANLAKLSPHVKYTSIRLGALTGGQIGLVDSDLLSKFTLKALSGQPFELIGGDQQVERLDVRDAASALISLMLLPSISWKNVYNLGGPEPFSLTEIANKVITISKKYHLGIPSTISTRKGVEPTLNFALDSSLLKKDTGWRHAYTVDSTIESLFDYQLKR